jgi:2-isopropylmalate synthase
LRDGAQSAGINFSLEDKLLITKKLDETGVDYVEGGWPMKGVNAKDFEYFKEVKKLKLKNVKIAAFGSTKRAKNKIKDDPVLNSLIEAGTEVVTIFGKSWLLHVKNVLHITPKENLEIIRESIEYLKENKKIVIYDAEHFFDGYKDNPEYAMECLKVAEQAGSDVICLCDTNGGVLPQEMDKITREIFENVKTPLGIHTHNDAEIAVANSIIAVNNGFTMVQGTINGLGERCGNANLVSIIPALSIKMDYVTITERSFKKITELSHYVYEIANVIPPDNQPYTGKNAFAHKAGIHADAMLKEKKAYEHINPEIIGNERKILITDQAGTSALIHKANEMGFNLAKNDVITRDLIIKIKKLENEGYEFEAADASLFIFLKKNLSKYEPFFELKGLKVIDEERDGELFTEATIKIKVKNMFEHTAAEGNGPVNALDNALRKALIKFYPRIKDMRLVDFKVRVIDGLEGTAAKVRVLIESADNRDLWTTVGVSENIIEASWLALLDSVEYKLLRTKKVNK